MTFHWAGHLQQPTMSVDVSSGWMDGWMGTYLWKSNILIDPQLIQFGDSIEVKLPTSEGLIQAITEVFF